MRPGSAERSEMFSRRSAVLVTVGLFSEAAQDVERALQGPYPGPMRFRLHLRRALCLREMGEPQQAEEQMRCTREALAACPFPEDKKLELLAIAERSFEQPLETKTRLRLQHLPAPGLSHGADQQRPCLSEAVEIRTDDKFGRHWIAAQDIQTGDVLLKEEPAVFGLKDESRWTHCGHCLKLSFALVPCDACNKVLYCSNECQNEAWNNYHSVSCQPRKRYEDEVQTRLQLPENISASFVRIFDFIAQFGMDECANFENPSGKLLEFLQLLHHPVPYEQAIQALCRRILADCFEMDPDSEKVIKLAEFCSLALLKHNANSFSIAECFVHAPTDAFDLRHVGYGSYHTAALANHSCDPNVVCTYHLKTMVCRAIRPVKKGEQLFLRYCNTFYNLPRTVRHEKLSQYNFECDCDPCRLEWPTAGEMPEELSFVDQQLAASLRTLLRKETPTSGLAVDYRDLVNETSLQLGKKLQSCYFSEEAEESRLDKTYRLVELLMFFHWAAKTRSFECIA